MKTQIESPHFKVEEKLSDHIEKKTATLDSHHTRIENCKVVLKLNKDSKNKNKLIELSINIPGSTLFAKEQSESFEMATDLAIEKMKKQLEKHHQRPPHISIDSEV